MSTRVGSVETQRHLGQAPPGTQQPGRSAAAGLPLVICALRFGPVSLVRTPPPVIYPDFPLDLRGFFSRKHFIQFLANKMQDFRNFILHNCIRIFDAEQVYLT